MNIYAIYDRAAGMYNTPFFQPTDAHALRAFKAEVNRPDPSNYIYLYPSEYDLFMLGSYDDTNGVINPAQTKLTNGEAVKETKK